MTDWLKPAQRSYNMASIRSTRNRSTEELFAGLLRRGHVSGWRRHADIPGKPDFSFFSLKVAVFIDGCFWHACPKCFRLPEDNRAYWIAKAARNRLRDHRISRLLRRNGWAVVRIWEHSLKSESGQQRALRRLITLLGTTAPGLASR
jgi:DNA mismatch endonuclease, patch repair protein